VPHRLSTLAFALLWPLVACETLMPPEAPALELTGVVLAWERGEATARAEVPAPGGAPFAVASGTVSSTGAFALVLPEQLEEGLLFLEDASEQCDGLIVTPSYFKATTLAELAVYRRGERLGSLVYRSFAHGLEPEVGDVQVAWLYLDQPVTMQGSCQGAAETTTFDLRLQRGWNAFVWRLEALADEQRTVSLRSTAPPPSVRWHFTSPEAPPPPQGFGFSN
jgi:hypothetical protein